MNAMTAPVSIRGDGPIVMVDDSYDDYFIASRMYARSVLTNDFVHCDSGPVICELLDSRAALGESQPALILMDLNMPGMNGIEVITVLRAKEPHTEIPIIAMLTGSVDGRDAPTAANAGADAYYTKPMDARDYITMFDSFAE